MPDDQAAVATRTAGSQTAAGNPAVRELSAKKVYAAMTDRQP